MSINRYKEEGIAVIGIGCYYPKANGKDQFWNNIQGKVNCITDIPAGRWDPAIYYDPDKTAPDKTYSKIGGFVDDIDFHAITVKYKIPPRVITAMDRSQKFALLATGDALADAGYADKDFDRSRTAVIIGNSMGGDKIDYTNLRIFMGEIGDTLKKIPSFSKIDAGTRNLIVDELTKKVKGPLPEVTEDTMPGELANVIAGRISNALNLTGPSFSVDAACASSLASLKEATRGLRYGDFDMAVAGGTDFLMGPGPYIKFCKIGALSPDGSRPFDAKANGFVMGEGTGIFILKRVSDARRDGDKIYAMITGVGSSADGKGKGITAPNPKGQTLAIERAFVDAGYGPETVQYIETHGTSTVAGDLGEMEGLLNLYGNIGLRNNSIGIGSVKSNIGHLKAAAGSASVIKLALALQKKVMPPSINFKTPNPNIAFGNIPFRVITESEEWPKGIDGNPRRGNASAFGFGGTNFHVAFEEDTGDNGMPSKAKLYTGIDLDQKESVAIMNESQSSQNTVTDYTHKRYDLSDENYRKLEGEAVVIGGSSWEDVNSRVEKLKKEMAGSDLPLREIAKRFNVESNSKDYRLGISAFSAPDLIDRLNLAPDGYENLKKRMVLKNKGLFYGEHLLEKKKSLAKVCVMFPGQGSQYINMLKDLYNKYKVVKDSFDEADQVMHGIIGRAMTEIIFQEENVSKEDLEKAENLLKQTEYTQPGVLSADYAMFRLLRSYGINPDMVVGHSLGEYGALVAAEVMSFRDALYAVSARGREIANVKWDDVGKMLSVPASVAKTEELMKGIPGYIIIANKNCHSQTVVGGETPSIKMLREKCEAAGVPAQEIPVSHAFHSKIVAPACASYRKVLETFKISSPKIDIVANLTGDYYPKGENVRTQILDILEKHIASPVEFIKQVERMYADGVNVFVEAGPKRTMSSFVLNILEGKPHLAMATNHPKRGGIGTLNDALASMSTQGFDVDWNGTDETGSRKNDPDWRLRDKFLGKPEVRISSSPVTANKDRETISDLERSNIKEMDKNYQDISSDKLIGDFQAKQKELVKDVIDIYTKKSEELLKEQLNEALYYKRQAERFNINYEKIVISGTALGLPGQHYKVFDDNGFDRMANGVNMIDPVPHDVRDRIAEKNITRLIKKSDGEASFETISDRSDVVKLVGRKGEFNFQEDYGFNSEYSDKLEMTTQLAIAAGIEALKDAGIPLVMNYKRTSTNKLLPVYWALPEDMQDDTGIIFAAAFPGENSVIEEVSKALAYKYGTKSKKDLIKLYTSLIEKIKDDKIREDLSAWYAENYSMLKDGMGEDTVYEFNRKFIFRILVMGHSQFAELIKAKGPNIHMNSACASTTAATGIAEDWIRTGRAKRVIIIAADDVTSNTFIEWILSGFLAVGAVTIQERIENAAIPFDKRRNGFIVGMGAVGIIVEAESEVKKRGMEPIVELVSTEFSNSAFHGTRIDNDHVSEVMEKTVRKAENRLGITRAEMAKQLLFMSHETYTPARGGSASSEVNALRRTFRENCNDVIISNTKGFTGHAMAVGIEDVVAVKCLQTTKVPPIANYKEVDPELGEINLSKGGKYEHIKYALRLGAGFGSQVAMSVMKLVSRKEDRVVEKAVYKNWLKEMSGIENPEIEIVNRTLRVKDDGSILKKDREAPVQKTADTVQGPAVQPAIIPVAAAAPARFEAAPAQNVAQSGDETIKTKIMQIVGEKTGYPEDLIEFDLDMESDLGIDTVKQAEMFGMIRDAFGISSEEGIKIKDFPTLNHVVDFVKQKSPMKFAPSAPRTAAPVQAAQAPAPSAAPAAGDGLEEVRKKIIQIVGEKTGYPEDLIEFDLDMESDLGIDTVKQAEMFGMIRDAFSISAEEGIKIKDFPTLNHVVEFVRQKSPMKFAANAAVSPAPKAAAPASVSAPAYAAAAPAAAPASADGLDEVRKKIVKIVEEKTGYPEDLIEFDLDMESDLGIDTVKQAEMFGMIRDTFKIPSEEGIKIKDFPTLNHVVEFVRQKSSMKFAAASSPAAPAQAALVQPAAPAAAPQVSAKAAPAATPAGGSGDGLDEVRKKIVKIVEEKTGYPEDLIEFDLDMESDLGIDTVKQAEMFGMIREIFRIPSEEGIKIKDFPTLSHVVEFVRSKSPDFSAAASVKEIKTVEKAEIKMDNAPSKSGIKRMTLEMDEEQLDENAKDRFSFKGFNVILTDDGRGIALGVEKLLKDAEANVNIIRQSEMEDTGALSKAIEKARKAGSINGIIHLTSLEESKAVDEMTYEEWRKNVFRRVKALYFIAKTVEKDIKGNAEHKKAFVASVTDMGGTFGVDDFTANNPIGGGVQGLTKALSKEFNQTNRNVLVKAIDMEIKGKSAQTAKTILREIQKGSDRVEVGYTGKSRMIPRVIYKDIDTDAAPRKVVGEGSVFVVTGGGYGITAAISKDLAKHLKVKLALISLESLPENIAELASLDANGLKALKDKIVAELKSKNERVTPVMIDKEYGKYTIAIDIYKNCQEMKKLGSPDVEYYSCNVMDHKAMTAIIDKIRKRFGSIDAIIHGAGIEQSKLMEDKSFEDFCRVVDVKADGCYNLMESTRKDNVRVLVTFASIAGRFGNIGQTDYSAANDLLNKYVEHANRRYAPDMKAVSMNWSGWMGVGMATRGSITKLFEEGGVDMIPMEEGVTKVREELLYGNDAEILVAGRVGYIDSDNIIAGYNTKEYNALLERVKDRNKFPMVDSIDLYQLGKRIVIRKKLDTDSDLYLADHSIENIPYLPAVMGIETFAEAAGLLFPKKRIKLMKDIRFTIPVKILKGKPIDLIVSAEKTGSENGEITVKTRLETEFFNKDGIKLGENRLHFEAVVVLSEKGADRKKLKSEEIKMDSIAKYEADKKIAIDDKEIYRRFFHGPRFQVHGGVINLDDRMIYGVMERKNGKGEKHFSFTKKPCFMVEPMVIEAAFQNAGLYAMAKKNKSSLPDMVGELVFADIPSDTELYLSAKYIGGDDMKHEFDTAVVDKNGNVYSVLKSYKMINTGDLKDNEKF